MESQASTRIRAIYRVTLIGSMVNAALIVVKLAAGIVGRSSALTADAVHSLSDFLTDIIVLVFVRISGKPKDADHNYGHGKYETFSAMVIGVILCFVGAGLGLGSAIRVFDAFHGNPLPAPEWTALIVAALSIIAKESLFRYTITRGRRLNSTAVIANAWHHRSDAFSSIGALAGIAGAMFLGPDWRVLDPIAAIIVSVFIIKSGIDITRPNIGELLEKSLSPDDENRIRRIVMSVPGVKAEHNLRTRRIGNIVSIEMHAKMAGHITLTEAHNIASEIERRIRDAYGSDSLINIHMEPAK